MLSTGNTDKPGYLIAVHYEVVRRIVFRLLMEGKYEEQILKAYVVKR